MNEEEIKNNNARDNWRLNETERTRRRELIWREIDVALSSKCPLLHYLLY